MSQALEQIKKLVESNNPDLKTPEFVVAMAYMIYKEEKMRWLTNAGIVTASGSTQSALKNSLILFAQQNHNDQKFNEFINKPILNLNDYNKVCFTDLIYEKSNEIYNEVIKISENKIITEIEKTKNFLGRLKVAVATAIIAPIIVIGIVFLFNLAFPNYVSAAVNLLSISGSKQK